MIIEMKPKIAVIIPCYKVKNKIAKLIEQLEEVIDNLKEKYEIIVYIVNDCCPDESWSIVQKKSFIKILHHKLNRGVGAAFLTGLFAAQTENCQVYLKIDSDNQHLPYYLYEIIPYVLNLPSYELFLLKGSRYFPQRTSFNVPFSRKIGSLFIEPLARVSLGYRGLTDIANGFFAFNSLTCNYLFNKNFSPKLQHRYLFESSLIERCSFLECNIHEFLMCARYDNDWSSSLNTLKIIIPLFVFFSGAALRRLRNLYLYKLNFGTILLLLLVLSFLFNIKLFFSKILFYLRYDISLSSASISIFASVSIIFIFSLITFFIYDYAQRKSSKKIKFNTMILDLELLIKNSK